MYRLIAATMVVLAVAADGYTQTKRPASNSSSTSYSKEQAGRGKTLYSRYCSACHLENLKGNCPSEDLASSSYICAAAGNESTYTFDDAARIRARKPAGQWNSVEIVSKDGQTVDLPEWDAHYPCDKASLH